MPGFVEHLESLAGSSTVPSGDDRRLLEQWLSLRPNQDDSQDVSTIDDEAPWPSVRDVYSSSENDALELFAVDTLIQDLESKPHMNVVLPNIFSLLSSGRTDDAISEELAEILGFAEIELVSEILKYRRDVVSKLEAQTLTNEKTEQYVNLKSKNKPTYDQDTKVGLDLESAKQRMEETLRANAARPLFTGKAQAAPDVLPHVYTSSTISQGNVLSQFGQKYMLPIDTTRAMYDEYEEVIIPPSKPRPLRVTERLISVSELDALAQGSFPGYTCLNRIQSIVYSTAYQTNENMLVSAPTGAGKTDVAVLTILRVFNQHRSAGDSKASIASTIRRDEFKIIYVAPMKALASEIVRKFSKRLKWLSIRVRELTGDMQLTKTEIAETQIIVTTPEKWDVVTRKPTGEGELASKVKLLIIDEVHLLNEERGAVIETIVARTLRQVETTQSLIRIVGLSATLPNYVDVADFLRVSRYHGLFFFDSSFRPVPLEQHFIGIKGKQGSPQSRKNLDQVTYDKVASLVNQGHQVMVFVHARKETVKTSLALKDGAITEGTIDEFSCEDHPSWHSFRRDVGTSRNKEMKQLFDHGFGIHHAGMLRSDRNLMEQLFEARAIKVLCCTATLAWGVNLPAHAVVIKGTQVYDSTRGKFVDLSVLDVLQIFGRAGRPGMESSGEGYICTTEDKLSHYLEAVTAQNPIESKFVDGMIDSLNAEISLGTVSNVTDAVQWIGYTYLFVRMRKNPFLYGMLHGETDEDPLLGNKRHELVVAKARQLSQARMITFDERTGGFAITDLGRIAAKYYIRSSSVEIFNKAFRAKMSEADVLGMLSMSTEFDQIQLRETETDELKAFMDDEDIVPCQAKGGTDTSQGKVNILLQAHISRRLPEDFALVSDMAYVAQNGGRIIRALLEIAISRKWAESSAVLMAMSKAIEKRIWPFEHPLIQFEKELHSEVLYSLRRWADNLSVAELVSKSSSELGKLIHMNERHGSALLKAAKQFPTVVMTYDLRPLSADLLWISVHIKRAFEWGSRSSNSHEPFWLWVEDHEGMYIIQLSQLVFREKTISLDADFTIPLSNDKASPWVSIRFVSERWLGAEDDIQISLEHLAMPAASNPFTPLLSLPFLSLDTIENESLMQIFSAKVQNFNAIQTHSFWNILSVNQNALFCAPSGSGKSTLGQMLLIKSMQNCPIGGWALVVLPRRSLASDLVSELRALPNPSGFSIQYIVSPDMITSSEGKVIRITTTSTLIAAMSHHRWTGLLAHLCLVVCEDLELLDAEYELGLSLLLHAVQTLPVRFVGFSAPMADASDITSWLRVRPASLCSFKSSDRDQDLTTIVQAFNIPHSAALFKVMAKPAHSAIRSGIAGDPSVIFVPSRAQCRAVASDLITQCAIELEMQGYLPAHLSVDDLQPYITRLRDRTLVDFLTRGIGIFHEGLHQSDRTLTLEIYAEGIIRVLLVPRDSCWSLPVRAGVVIVMGTQYVRVEGEVTERQVKDYSIAEIIRMQGRATRHMRSGRFYLFCQAGKRETLTRFLDEGLLLESTLYLSPQLERWYIEQRREGLMTDRQHAVDALSWTFLARRIASNPMYYGAIPGALDDSLSRLVDHLDACTKD